MAETLQAARGLVQELELHLRDLIVRAAAAGEYEAVAELAELTNQVGALVPAATTAAEEEHPTTIAPETRQIAKPSGRTAGRSIAAKKTTSRASSYPLFCRQGDFLVKVGWSRSARREYEHRVPRYGVEALVKHLVGLRANQFPLSVDAMIQALSGDKDANILGYQVYVVVAWLKQEGLLAANGRHGYTLRKAKGIAVESIVENLWAQLPAHSRL